jgi:hypothetical protein
MVEVIPYESHTSLNPILKRLARVHRLVGLITVLVSPMIILYGCATIMNDNPSNMDDLITFASVFGGAALMPLGLVTIASGTLIARRKNRAFSIFVAVINFVWVPIGTILATQTLIDLNRASVVDEYSESDR